MKNTILIVLAALFGHTLTAKETYIHYVVANPYLFKNLFEENELNYWGVSGVYRLTIDESVATLESLLDKGKVVEFTVTRKENLILLQLTDDHLLQQTGKMGLFTLYQENDEKIHWNGRLFLKDCGESRMIFNDQQPE